MPSGASSAVLAPETGRSDRIHQLLDRLARSVADTRAAVEPEVVAAPSFVGDMAALARTAMAAAEDAAAAAISLQGQAAPTPRSPAPLAPPAMNAPRADEPTPPLAKAPAADASATALQPLSDVTPRSGPDQVQATLSSEGDLDWSLPGAPDIAPAPLDIANGAPDLPGSDDLPQDIVLQGPFAFSLVDSRGEPIDHAFVRVDPMTGQIRPRADAPSPTTAFTANVQICDALGVRLIERVEVSPDVFALAQSLMAAPIEADADAVARTAPPATRADEAVEVLVIDELGPVEADFGAYLTTGSDGVVQLIRLPEQEQNGQPLDIIIIDLPINNLVKTSEWRAHLRQALGNIPSDALWARHPGHRPFPRTVYNPFRNAGTSRVVVRLACADLRVTQVPDDLIVARA